MKLAIVLLALVEDVEAKFVKGTFHQHATQPWRKCHYAAKDIMGGGTPDDMDHEQDDGGTDADDMLKAMAASGRNYTFVGIAGNEELPLQPKSNHGLIVLNVTENQMGKMCTKGERHCHHPCEPVVPAGSGPWTTIDINNLHREYIQGIPGYFVQHPTTDFQRDQMLAQMQSGDSLLRGMEVYNSWQQQAWDYDVPLNDTELDPLYPVYKSDACLAWFYEASHKGSCSSESPQKFWDATLRAMKRPIYGLADDDGFDYTGNSEDPIAAHKKGDVKSNTPAWFRFGEAWSMVDVPSDFTAADIVKAVDGGKFYGSTGIDLTYDIAADVVSVTASEPVTFGVAGGVGDESSAAPLDALNVTLCLNSEGVLTNVGCPASSPNPPPRASKLHLDLGSIVGGSLFYVRIQAMVRTRYPIVTAPTEKANKWEFELSETPNPADVKEGRLIRATGGKSRRPLVVEAVSGKKVQVVNKFSHGYGEITPDQTTVTGITAGTDQLVAERWAWMQPIFRKRSMLGELHDPFAQVLV